MRGCGTEQYTFQTQMHEVVEVEKEVEVYVVEKDHTKLTNRDAADQHPLSAITNLKKELDQKVTSENAMTNMDILNIIGG